MMIKSRRKFLTCILAIVALFSFAAFAIATAQNARADGAACGYDVGNGNSAQAKITGLYFGLAENSATFNGDWSCEYDPTTEDAYQLIRDGQTYNIGYAAQNRGTIVKYGETSYYLKCENGWMVNGYDTYFSDGLLVGDILKIEGTFVRKEGTETFDIGETYFVIGGESGKLTYTVTDKLLTYINAGAGQDAGEGAAAQTEFAELKFSLPANSAAENYRFTPETEGAVKLTRGGVTTDVGHTARETILKINDTLYSFQVWVLADNKPLLSGDVLVLEGNFKNAELGVVLNISKTYIQIGGEAGALTYTVSDGIAAINAGKMSAHPVNAVNYDANGVNGFYFSLLDGTKVPFDAGWALEYSPVNANVCQLIRGGEAYSFGNGDRGTIVKYSETECYFATWVLAELNPIQNGDIIVLSGGFKVKSSAEGATFEIDETAVVLNKKGESWSMTIIPEYRQYLIDTVENSFVIEEYDEEDQIEIRSIADGAIEKINNEELAGDAYKACVGAVEEIGKYEVSPEIIAELTRKKEQGKAEIKEYVDIEDYYENEQDIITQIIIDCLDAIDEAKNKSSVQSIVDEAKAKIDVIKTAQQIIEDRIAGKEEGYEEYLEKYDVVSLRELNLGDEQELLQYKDARNAEITDTQENTVFNSFVASEDNVTDSVIFKFAYRTDFDQNKNNNNTNLAILIRGVHYYGYKFTIGTSNNGAWIHRGESDEVYPFLAGEGNLLFANTDYELELGVIDIVNSNRTWVFLKINGRYALSAFCDKISFGSGDSVRRTRVALRTQYDVSEGKDLTTVTTIKNITEGITVTAKTEAGLARYASGHSNVNQGIYVTLGANSLPYAADMSVASYALSSDSIKLVRGGNETNVASLTAGAIFKYSETGYYIDLKGQGITVEDGDKIVIDGDFACFNSDLQQKIVYGLSKTQFVYSAQNDAWEQVLTLEEAKADAKVMLETYKSLNLYDEEDRETVLAAIEKGKEAIEGCTDLDGVTEALNAAKAAVDAIPTSFDKLISAAIDEINGYKNESLSDYREDEKNEIAEIKANACSSVSAATEESAINEIVANAKSEIDKVKTDEQLSAEELKVYKEEASGKIKDHYASLDISKFSAEEQTNLNAAVKKAIADVENAVDKAAVDEIVKNFTESWQNKTGGCNGSLNGGAFAILAVLCAAATVLFKRKRSTK